MPEPDRAPRPAASSGRPPLVLASRGDALTPYLFGVLEERFEVAGRVDPELTRRQRLLVAASTFRPRREAWVERFYKSHRAYRMRSANARRALADLGAAGSPVLQVHALFELPEDASFLYVDCTHQQTVRSWPAWNPLRGAALAAWLDRERSAYHAAEHVFAFSGATRRSLLEDYGLPADRVTVVGAGVNAHVLPEPWFDRRADADGPVLLLVGNDFDRKGGRLLLEAFARLRRTYPRARLLLAGTRPTGVEAPGVEVLGRVHDRGAVHALYRRADLFVLPALYDPFPLVLLEAMAHGLPVVTSDTCGVPEMVRDDVEALVVPTGDVDAFTGALVRALTDPDGARRRAVAARRRVEEEFTWQRVVDRMAPALAAPPRAAAAPGPSPSPRPRSSSPAARPAPAPSSSATAPASSSTASPSASSGSTSTTPPRPTSTPATPRAG